MTTPRTRPAIVTARIDTTPDADTTPHCTDQTTPDARVLWQHLTDALNALINAGQFPNFHDLYGAQNDWHHQPYATASSHADAPWVVLDLSARQFTVSSRKRTLSGEHSPRPPRKRR